MSSDAPRIELMRSLNELYTAGQYSDLTIKCGTDTYKVHKAIVCTRSAVLASMCKENTFKEGKQGIITLAARSSTEDGADIECDDPQAVKSMITYFYTLDYAVSDLDVSPTNKARLHDARVRSDGHYHPRTPGTTCFDCLVIPAPHGRMLHHADVYAIGDKYAIPALKDLSKAKFRQTAVKDWNSFEFIDCIGKVYSTTPASDRGLRDIVVEVLVNHSKCLLSETEMQALLVEMPDLAFEVLNHSAGYKVFWDTQMRLEAD